MLPSSNALYVEPLDAFLARIGDKPGPILHLKKWNREVRRRKEWLVEVEHARHVEETIAAHKGELIPGSWTWLRDQGDSVGIAALVE